MCGDCNWEDYLDKIDEMMSARRYHFAADTLEDIGLWVEENEHITEKQAEAVDNIERSKE